MYKLHLILKYLRKRRIAWVALLAVMLCTTMVLVVISVMGGWLRMFRQSFHSMSGDIVVRGESLVGFPHYEEMIDRITQLKEVRAASPVIRTFGLVNIYNDIRRGVQVIALRDDCTEVNGFAHSLNTRKDATTDLFALRPDVNYELYKPPRFKGDPRSWPGMIVGAGVIGIRKNEQGVLQRPVTVMYHAWVRLTLLPISPYSATIDVGGKAEEQFWIVDDSRTQVYQYDSETVYAPFDVVQRMLNMNESSYEDVETGEKRTEPARTSEIQIAARPGADLDAVRDKVEQIANTVRLRRGMGFQFPIRVETWEQTNAKFLSAIEKEKVLVTGLFGVISLVAVFLVFCIFYMIVMEKTRDIGILKSVGATSSGVAGIFLGYGAAIGVVGSAAGLLVGWLIVHNINELHAMLGELMGVQIWSPDVYMFDRIPNQMNPPEVIVIVAVAILASVVGALWPAIRAAGMHPVEALRWE